MSLTDTAIKLLQSTAPEAIEKMNSHIATAPAFSNAVCAVPDSFVIADMEKYMLGRRRARGSMETSNLSDFASYTVGHAEPGTTVFVDADHMRAVAVLNLGTSAEPGHADNTCRLTAQRTAAMDALRQIANGGQVKQAQLAEFMEDWADLINAFNGDEELIPQRQAIAALRKITIETARKVESEERAVSASRSTFESIKASDTANVPTTLDIELEPYQGLEIRMFRVRINLLTGSDKPIFTLRIVKWELHEQEMAAELAKLVEDELEAQHDGDVFALPVLLGTYSPKA